METDSDPFQNLTPKFSSTFSSLEGNEMQFLLVTASLPFALSPMAARSSFLFCSSKTKGVLPKLTDISVLGPIENTGSHFPVTSQMTKGETVPCISFGKL